MITEFPAMKKLKILTCKGMVPVDINTIIRIEANSNYSKIFFVNGTTLVVAKVLRWFEENLLDDRFVRIHRTHIVNKLFIREYLNGTIRPARGGKVFMANGECIDVSKRKKIFFLKSWYQPAA